jgi:DNA excision repair protein ERCC-2
LDDVKKYGQEKGVCPYFTIRRMVSSIVYAEGPGTLSAQMPYLDIVIFSFHYLLDPKVAENVSAELSKESIIVFDEAHNIGALQSRSVRASQTDFQITSVSSHFLSI